eukprot:4919806-Karenia_brevis.AAC.1
MSNSQGLMKDYNPQEIRPLDHRSASPTPVDANDDKCDNLQEHIASHASPESFDTTAYNQNLNSQD